MISPRFPFLYKDSSRDSIRYFFRDSFRYFFGIPPEIPSLFSTGIPLGIPPRLSLEIYVEISMGFQSGFFQRDFSWNSFRDLSQDASTDSSRIFKG